MKKLFYKFIQDNKIKNLITTDAAKLSIQFNSWITALGNSRNKRIVNESNKHMIRKWIENGEIVGFANQSPNT